MPLIIIIAKQYLYIYNIFLSRKLKPSHFIQSLAKKVWFSHTSQHFRTNHFFSFLRYLTFVFLITDLLVTNNLSDPINYLFGQNISDHIKLHSFCFRLSCFYCVFQVTILFPYFTLFLYDLSVVSFSLFSFFPSYIISVEIFASNS